MRKFKLTEAWLNTVLFIALSIWCIIENNKDTCLRSWFIISWVQVAGMFIHELKRWFTGYEGLRRKWHLVAALGILCLPLGSFTILFYAAPLTGICYIFICFHEVYIKMQRPLALLK